MPCPQFQQFQQHQTGALDGMLPCTLGLWPLAAHSRLSAEHSSAACPAPAIPPSWLFYVLSLLLWLPGLILPCSCEEKGLMVKVQGTNTSDVICGKCLLPRAGPVLSRDLLVLQLLQHSEELAWPVGVFGTEGSDHTSGMIPSCLSLSL